MSLFYIEREAWSIGCPLVCWPLHMHYDASVLMLLSAGELYSSFASSLWVALESVTQQRQYPLAHLNWYSWSTGYSYEYTKLTGRLGKENVWELLVGPSSQPITTHVWWCVYMHTPPGLPVSRAGVRRENIAGPLGQIQFRNHANTHRKGLYTITSGAINLRHGEAFRMHGHCVSWKYVHT